MLLDVVVLVVQYPNALTHVELQSWIRYGVAAGAFAVQGLCGCVMVHDFKCISIEMQFYNYGEPLARIFDVVV